MTGRFSMRCSCALVTAVVLACGTVAVAQGPTYHLGRTPTQEELKPWDAAIGIDGEGLPQGSGTAKQGATIYMTRGCAGCHGPHRSRRSGPAVGRDLLAPITTQRAPGATQGPPGLGEASATSHLRR